MFLTPRQLCSGFLSTPWQEHSKLGPETMGVTRSAGPGLDVSSDSLVRRPACVSCLPNHPLPSESRAPTWCSAAGAFQCSGGRFRQPGCWALLALHSHALPHVCTAALHAHGTQRPAVAPRGYSMLPRHVPKDQPWGFHLVSYKNAA